MLKSKKQRLMMTRDLVVGGWVESMMTNDDKRFEGGWVGRTDDDVIFSGRRGDQEKKQTEQKFS